MLTLDSLRSGLTDAQRTLLEQMWHHYFNNGEWPVAWEFHRVNGKSRVQEILKSLNGSVVIEQNDGQRGSRYQLTFLGILLTPAGSNFERLLVGYLEYIRARYQQKGEAEITKGEAQKALDLDFASATVLGQLIEIGNLYGNQMSRSPTPLPGDWSAMIYRGVEDFPQTGSLTEEVGKLALGNYNPDAPVLLQDQQARLQQAARAAQAKEGTDIMDSSIQLIKRLITEGEKFDFKNAIHVDPHGIGMRPILGADKAEWRTWKIRCRNVVLKVSGDDSPAATLIKDGWAVITEGNYTEKFDKAKEAFLGALKICLVAAEEDTFGELLANRSGSKSTVLSNKIFIVHGHDELLKNEVERFIHQIGLEPIVLHRQPDKGQTIIEKFEENSDVGYAFILLTPDEIAYTKDQESLPDSDRTKQDRARPYVIFEFGYFIGKLGRNRVCCLYKKGVVLPTDIQGMIYKEISKSVDEAGYYLIQELQAAGYEIKLGPR